jgi:S-adenosylmethionine decarboxylase
MEEEHFGPHLAIDLVGCPKELLSDLNLHFNFLNEVPEIIGMTKITQPHVFPYSGLVPEDRGITGVVIIAESHLSVHSFEQKGYAFIDIFSCKGFNTDLVVEEVLKRFQPTTFEVSITKRGKDFPR